MMKVAEADGKPMAEVREDKLHLTIESDRAEELLDVGSRKFAYDQRGRFGFGEAGLESFGGCYQAETPEGVTVYRRTFVLTRPL